MDTKKEHFTAYQKDIEAISLPEKFTFPFYYEAHPLSILASEELQQHLENQTNWKHDFGINNPESKFALGKMFGVLVVQDEAGYLGYLSAFSGKLADSNHLPGFVPPVFDILEKEGFYKTEEQEVNALNEEVKRIEDKPDLTISRIKLEEIKKEQKTEVEEIQAQIRENRKTRKIKRIKGKEDLNEVDFENLLKELSKESISEQYFLKDKVREWKEKVNLIEAEYLNFKNELSAIREKRGQRSAQLQRKIFDHYTFLNAEGNSKSLMEIFSFLDGGFPPAGSGECAAPKLLQYAYMNKLKPIAMAEFWWGKSPASEIRKHKHYYPSCRNKCEPILGHMLTGMEIDENPILAHPSYDKELVTIYEDDAILVVNKPSGLLSVPGKTLNDSVDQRMRDRFPATKTPLIVHRLDMATSGLMLLAKTKEAHKSLQALFIKRTIKKRYVAILDGIIEQDSGFIDLPLRLDIDNRPYQLVCDEFGKKARTEYRVIERKDGKTRIHFFPITGRSHQLRVHASHVRGLNTAIVGDDLYGTKDERLMLHAEWLRFKHPVSHEWIELEVEAEF